MYMTIFRDDFIAEFARRNREDNFSTAALMALFDYYSDLESYVLDVIAICVEWAEYSDIEDACRACSCESLHELEKRYNVIYVNDNCILIGQ